ncbi:MAG: glycoside hydrolase family 16 protein [Sporocytophaga sp.]|uniref:glycoside hydrolase family 16 protein n=1 Tax=Sporocytophaga sp. TaxID=2231183 RepID=UPI001B242A47|nr:glycoside hydrolase family 16 protein [Sporocytophaga sp.]MBO9700178.1 glycoside hydrolase family 16 protein [Sporocytophaga sp.]
MKKINIQIFVLFLWSTMLFGQSLMHSSTETMKNGPGIIEVSKNSSKLPCVINYNDWNLSFLDDFNGSVKDLSENWYLFGDNHGPDELQIYKWDQLSVSGGNLVITAQPLPEPVTGSNGVIYNYTSGWIHYKNMVKGNALFEIRCKMPEGREQSLWPAFWMWNGDCSQQTDGYREIDIFEYWGNNFKCGTNNVFWCDGSRNRQSCFTEYCEKQPDFFNDFHIFSVAWLKDKLVFYIDGKEIRTVKDHVPLESAEMYLIANLALANSPSISDVKFPQYFTIDWIKIYNLKDKGNTLETCTRSENCEKTSTNELKLLKASTTKQ